VVNITAHHMIECRIEKAKETFFTSIDLGVAVMRDRYLHSGLPRPLENKLVRVSKWGCRHFYWEYDRDNMRISQAFIYDYRGNLMFYSNSGY